MRSFLAAAQFLTRVPLGRFQAAPDDLRNASCWFGGLGLVLGAVLAGADFLLRRWIAPAPTLVLVLCLNAVITGALHLDGLADTLDALGARERGRALAVMRDSRIGTYGVLGLAAMFGLQYSALVTVAPWRLTQTLLLAPAWGRAAIVLSAAVSRPARADGLGAAFLSSVRWRHVVAAWAPPAVVSLLLHNGFAVAAGLGAAVLAVGLAAAFYRWLGGQTGDTLGCVNQTVETFIYWLAMVAR